MAKGTGRPGHAVGSHAAAGSAEQAHRFPPANRKGVGKAKASTRGELQARRAGWHHPCRAGSLQLQPGLQGHPIIQFPTASGC